MKTDGHGLGATAFTVLASGGLLILLLGVCAMGRATSVKAEVGRVGGPADSTAFQNPGRFYPAPTGISDPVPETWVFQEATRQYAEHFGVTQGRARADMLLQGRTGGLEADLRQRLGEGFAQVSFDHEHGAVKLLLSPSGDRALAQEILAEHNIKDAIVERRPWSASDLDAATTFLTKGLAPLIGDGLVATHQAAGDGLVVDVDPRARDETMAAVKDAADAAGVRPLIDRQPVSSARAATCGGSPDYFCDAPFMGGSRYDWPWVPTMTHSCSAGFAAYVTGSSTPYNLTAGHCINTPSWPSPGQAHFTCNAAKTSCPYVNYDVGGYYTGNGQYDGGVMQHTNGSFPNYPGIYTYGSPYDSAPIHGWSNAVMSAWVCHTGYRTHSVQCGTVTTTNNGYGQFVFDTACTIGGDSGGPIFDPSNLYALGITATVYNTPLSGPCDSTTETGGEPVTRILSTLGLSGISTI